MISICFTLLLIVLVLNNFSNASGGLVLWLLLSSLLLLLLSSLLVIKSVSCYTVDGKCIDAFHFESSLIDSMIDWHHGEFMVITLTIIIE
jgi:hypothetical protein